MNILIIIAIVALLIIFIYFKINNFRTKIAFFFIFLGVIFILFFAFLFSSESNSNFAIIGKFIEETKIYLLWIKSALGNVIEFTGKIIGVDWIQDVSKNIRK